jgi:cellulose synthase/poly-beta-1,6-N-acetylglucosamine synthase-like glycosyltransferase
VLSIRQSDFTYPKALNMGFAAARYDYVMSLVGHSTLSSTYMLKSLTRWCGTGNLGGVYGLPLPAENASVTERISGAMWLLPRMVKPLAMKQSRPGLLGANTSIVSRKAWKQLGGYDERYAGGGEDTALGRSMIAAGMTVVYDPICSVFHSHGLGPIDMLRQIKHWNAVAADRPQTFDASRLLARRPDLRQKEKL